MQLRVARLCLDCEELHTENRCPRCASDSYAFLSTWLPTEERRRWRKPSAQPAHESRLGGFAHAISRLFRGEGSNGAPTPARRRSDTVPDLSFEDRPAARGQEGSANTAERPAPSTPRT